MPTKPVQDVENLLQSLARIERELESLNFNFEWCDEVALAKLNFDKATLCANELFERIHVTTHETASGLGFARAHLVLLRDYMLFRNRFGFVSTGLMREIVDGENSLDALKLYQQQGVVENAPSVKEAGKVFAQIRADWNRVFANQSFERVTKRLRL